MRPVSRRSFVRVAGAVGVGSASGCSVLRATDSNGGRAPSIVVGSKGFTEQEILGYLSLEALAYRTRFGAVDSIGFGGSLDNWQGLVDGIIDTYWEYTATQWLVLPPNHDSVPAGSDELYRNVVESAAANGVTVLRRGEFSNPFVLAASESWIAETGIETLGDLTDAINAGDERVSLALGADFYHRPDGWPGLVDHYGIDGSALAAMESGATDRIVVLSIGLSYELLRSGVATIVMGFGTDAELARDDLRVLRDDEDFFAPYNPVPLVDSRTVERHPAVAETLDQLGPLLGSARSMRKLNARVEVDDEHPRAVARDVLRREGIIS